jgi:hypothetical protein
MASSICSTWLARSSPVPPAAPAVEVAGAVEGEAVVVAAEAVVVAALANSPHPPPTPSLSQNWEREGARGRERTREEIKEGID